MIKIDIISGFLGAGKTTLIKKLLKEALGESKVVLIENEFGEIGIDSGFLNDAGIEIKEMNSGCICCSLVGDFGASLREVITTYSPERILIEPSGVGKLSDVKAAVSRVTGAGDEGKGGLTAAIQGAEAVLNSAVVVVDAVKCKMYLKNFGEFFVDQISQAETIVLSRTDKLTETKLTQCIEMLREYNTEAVLITTPWEQLDGRMILDTMEKAQSLEQELLAEVRQEHSHHSHEHTGGGHHHDHHGEECTGGGHDHHSEECTGGGHGHDHHNEECTGGGHGHDHHSEECACGSHKHSHVHHNADEVFSSFGLETPAAYRQEDIISILEQLEDESRFGMVLRAKGMVASTTAADAGAKTWLHFDYVPGEIDIRPGNADVIGKICVIGARLREDELRALWRKEGKA